jgi:hypothetical protein
MPNILVKIPADTFDGAARAAGRAERRRSHLGRVLGGRRHRGGRVSTAGGDHRGRGAAARPSTVTDIGGGDLANFSPVLKWLPVAAVRRAAAEGSDWHAALYRTKAGSIRNTFANICSILRNAPEFLTLRYNEMTVSPELDGGTITDAQLGAAREGMENRYGFGPSADAIAAGFTTVASERAYHPVREYLEALRWDGRARLDRVRDRVIRTIPSATTVGAP